MMRTIDQAGGLHVYITHLVENMLDVDEKNSYDLLYRTPGEMGRFGGRANVREFLVRSPHKFLWDQVAVPYRAWREKADVVFNPKFSVPLVSHCPVAMSLREPAWWTWRQHYPAWNALFMRTMMPLYCARSAVLFPISQFVLDQNRPLLNLDGKDVVVAYPAPDERFRVIREEQSLAAVRKKYKLPGQFIFSAARVTHPGIEESSSFFPGKNVETTIRAYNLCRARIPQRLVIAGRRVREYCKHVGLTDEELLGVVFIGAVSREDMVLIYNLADLVVLPSYYESFAHVLVEAMACGCPVVASTTGACGEISGGAGLLADPDSPEDFAEKMTRTLSDPRTRSAMIERGLKRVSDFSWQATARTVVAGLERAGSMRRPNP
ncbi:MAG: glycosyltransferase family 4 protein [Acidobacteriota bacterium]